MEEEQEEEIYNAYIITKTNTIGGLCTAKGNTIFFEVIINGYLNHNEPKFYEFLRVNDQLFLLIRDNKYIY